MKPTRSKYTFAGWSEDKNSTIARYKPGDKYSANKAITLYAVWFRVEYKVTYHANGGSGGVSSQTKKWNKDLTLSKNIPHRSGYTFLGWTLSENSEDVSYSSGDKYKSNKDIDLYALWGKSMRKMFKGSVPVISVGSGAGMIYATCVYTEDYIAKSNKISFYNHRTFLNLDYSMVNDEENVIVYPPIAVTHKSGSGKELNSFVVNQKVDSLEVADYLFSKENRKKVTYDKGMEVIGTCGFWLRYGPDVWAPEAIEKKLYGEGKNAKGVLEINDNVRGITSEDKNTEYYFLLGKIEGEHIAETESKTILARGKNSVVYNTDIKGYVQQKKLSGAVTNQDIKDIIKYVLKEKELDREAENSGCHKSREDAEKYIKKLREELKTTDNYENILAFIAGTGLNEDDYWQAKVESYRRQLMRKEYIERKYQEAISEKEDIVPEDVDDMTEQEEAEIEESEQKRIDFIADLKENVVKESDIEIVGDLGEYI